MEPLYLFDLASRQTDWLTTRQTAIARNVANANTPGYRTQDIEPFAATLGRTALRLATTAEGHIGSDPARSQAARVRDEKGRNPDIHHSGNSVSIEEELLKAGSVSRQYSLNTSVVKKFHSLILSSARGPG
ncbi:flagellar basal-body rod protein FlgB [Pseudochelatococcus lubricantis]|uniref:Flagellar basal-body rod protein FlgB n=1 Tax=Pseudochelatococcus lubricantis TaxID=1538102 RepID=A0ABX0UVX4_9HYPH|nr:flagellar basal body rod protein FlgB [Pseudochelatococcus lubricantis]NIJ57107.1 flagellar basal-body rod protein FlgB [Pseudochelatococcus lubricantis]